MRPLLNISFGLADSTRELCLTFAPKWFLPRGVTVLLGPNGAGKTLLVRTLAGDDNFSAGSIIPATAGELSVILAGRVKLPEQADENTLIIIDDPFTGLDKAETEAFDTQLRSLVNQGCNLVLTASDPRLIPDFAQSVIRVDNLHVETPEDICGRDIDTVRRGYKYLFGYAVDLDRIPQTLYPRDSADRLACEAASIHLSIRQGEHIGLTGATPAVRSAIIRELVSVSDIPYGYVDQDMPEEFDDMSAIEVVGGGLSSADFDSRERTAFAAIWLDIFHNSHLADRKVSTLSSGERQQIYLMRALIGCPPLLFLDEPMASLDYGRRRSLRALISYIATSPASSPTTLIASTISPYDMPECVTTLYNISTHETQATFNQ